eukprot:TRINITY_DN7522_c0_g1_i1.p2 TRINITY_DN7522_c0_g1~~TRINITY_DN7522_c0_g1_i1.p2  ORF type:complete len:205 (-),score=27.46 TRINITY_DN7522_c0_g1_i1:67-633(-)
MSSTEQETKPSVKLDSQMEKLWYGEKKVRSPRSPRSRSQSESLPALGMRGGKMRPTSSQPYPQTGAIIEGEDEAVSKKKGAGEKDGSDNTYYTTQGSQNEFHSAGSLQTGTSSATQSQVQSPPPDVIVEKEKIETEKEDVALNPDKLDSEKENVETDMKDEEEQVTNDAVHCCRCICFRPAASHVKAA